MNSTQKKTAQFTHVRMNNTWEAYNDCWHGTQQIRNSEGGSYSKCSKCQSCICRHATAHRGILVAHVATCLHQWSPQQHDTLLSSLPCQSADPCEQFLSRCPQRKKSRGFRSGDLAGHDTGPPHPSHLSGNCVLRCFVGSVHKSASAPHRVETTCHTSNRQWHIFRQHR
jgi:hypothetical protein